MKAYLAIMAGGALGSALRYALSMNIDSVAKHVFPWGTLTVNIIGCFVIGLFTTLTGPDSNFVVSPTTRLFVVIGILGGFTTFSSFSMQTINLLRDKEWMWAGGNVALSLVLCLFGTACGVFLANAINLKS